MIEMMPVSIDIRNPALVVSMLLLLYCSEAWSSIANPLPRKVVNLVILASSLTKMAEVLNYCPNGTCRSQIECG